MGRKSTISWCDGTFNTHWGCTHVGPGCDGCYAETFAHRLGYPWGPGAPRRYFGDKHWDEPRLWDRQAAKDGKRPRIFVNSMSDTFDNEVDQAVRDRLWDLMKGTPHLTWMLLTKRIGNAKSMLPEDWAHDYGRKVNPDYGHVQLGATMVNQEEVDRDYEKLMRIAAGARFISCGPMLENIAWPFENPHKRPDMVIFEGESKQPQHPARPCDTEWIRYGVAQCHHYGIAAHVKQLGSNVLSDGQPVKLKDGSGANLSEWPPALQVRESPAISATRTSAFRPAPARG